MARDTNFYYSFVVLPRVKRQAIIAVWDFCRAIDDVVDERAEGEERTDAGTEQELAHWRQELDRCFDGQRPVTSQGQRLQPYIHRFKLPRHAFEDVIDGVRMDLGSRRYQTFEGLHQYCLKVASAVGLISVEIFGYEETTTRVYAVDLGVALQLTNIIRDVGADFHRGRVYLPLEDLARFGCGEADLGSRTMTDEIRGLIRFQCARARTYYEKAEAELPPRDARRLVAARIMGAIYFEILQRIERANYDVLSQIIRVPRPRRAVLAATTWAKTMAGM